VGITYPIFSTSSCLRDWNAIPTHFPLSLKAGPPEFPEFIAASICKGFEETLQFNIYKWTSGAYMEK